MNPKVEKVLPIILSIISSAGVVATGIYAAKAAPKAKEKIEEAKASKSKKKLALAYIKEYKWPIIIGGATMASIVSSTIISKKIEASLSATAIMLDTTLRKYKNKAKALLGDKADNIVKSIAEDDYKSQKENIQKHVQPEDDRVVYYEEHIGYFKAKKEDIIKAMAITNEKILTSYRGTEKTVTDHWASLKTFLEDAHAELISQQDIDDISYDYGWSSEYVSYVYYDDCFVHIKEHPHTDANGIVDYIVIQFDKEPIFGVLGTYNQWESIKSEYEAKCIAEYEEEMEERYYK